MSTNILAHNLMAMNAGRQLKLNEKEKAAVAERLSSGYRINRAADDASGLAMSEKMRRQIRGLTQGAYNIQEGISYCKTADGALNEVSDIMNRMEELAVKAANGTNSDKDRQAIDAEMQQLKAETERILGTTKYNEIYIWKGGEPKFDTVKTGNTSVNAVNFRNTSTITLPLTNNNAAAYPKGANAQSVSGPIRVEANETDGVRFYWTGYNGKTYYSNWKEWPPDEEASINDPDNPNNMITTTHPGALSVKVSDLMDYTVYPETKGIDATLSYTTNKYSTQADLIASLNSTTFTTTENTNNLAKTYKSDGSDYSNTVSAGCSIYYPAIVKSARDLDNTADTSFAKAKPSNGNNITKPSVSGSSYSGTWRFYYTFDGIGDVTASLTNITYRLSSLSEPDKGTWWSWYPNEDSPYRWQTSTSKNPPANQRTDVSGVIYALTNTTDGLLKADLDHDKTDPGSITLSFNLTANTPFTIESDSTQYTAVGTMTLSMNLNEKESLETVMNRLLAMNGSDLYSSSSSSNSDSGGVGAKGASSVIRPGYKYISIPTYGQVELPDPTPEKTIPIHTAPESTEDVKILITYPILNNKLLGLTDTNVLTTENALQALEDIQYAAEMVSENRVLFGAYQNRLEHAYNGTLNTVENTTASESRIRDADMAELMYWYSLNQILVNAGESMLAQATKNPETVLRLIQE